MLFGKKKKKKKEQKVLTVEDIFAQRLLDHGNRLFAVDLNKQRVFGSVGSVVRKASRASCLCLVWDGRVAEECGRMVFGEESVLTVRSREELLRALEALAPLPEGELLTAAELMERAPAFREAYPRAVVCFTDGSEGYTLHAPLCNNETCGGFYSDTDIAPYCVSDFFADAGYDHLVLDDVYRMLSFTERTDREDVSPVDYERTVFMNRAYDTPLSHSFKRMKDLAESAETCVLISDCVWNNMPIYLYAALKLLRDDFSYRKTKTDVMGRTRPDVYSRECESTYFEIQSCMGVTDILSICLRRLNGISQIAPVYVNELDRYLMDGIRYMTQEEVFLRVMRTLIDHYDEAGATNQILVRRLVENDVIADILAEMFFSDKLKGQLESHVTHTRSFELSREESQFLMELFHNYGGYVESAVCPSDTGVVHLYHDDMAFEETVRQSFPDVYGLKRNFDREQLAYSVTTHGDELLFKCAAVVDMLNSGELRSPVVLLSGYRPEDIREKFTALEFGGVFLRDFSELADLASDDGGMHVATCDYEQFRRSASFIRSGSVVLLSMNSDIYLMHTVLQKAAILCGEQVRVRAVVSYTNLDGHLSDMWLPLLFRGDTSFGRVWNRELPMSGGNIITYSDLIEELDSLYLGLRKMNAKNHREPASTYHEAFEDFGFNLHYSPEYMNDDFRVLVAVSLLLQNIFANSVTVGSAGRAAFDESISFEKNKLKSADPYVKNEGEKQVMFNVCAKQLHATCDILRCDCGSCKEYGRLRVNDFAVFSENVEAFIQKLEDTLEKVKSAEEERIRNRELFGEKIEPRNFKEMDAAVGRCRRDAMKALQKLKREAAGTEHTFYGDYGLVKSIKESVFESYNILFKRYYDAVIGIFSQATSQMETVLKQAGEIPGPSGDI